MSKLSDHSPYKGQCLCGSIKYAVDQIGPKMAHCHCSMCRKFHGAAFATYGEAKVDNFHWLQGEELLRTYLAPNGTKRLFCGNCGSSLVFVPSNDSGELVEFSMGTLDSETDINPSAHIFTDFGASWYEITGNLPQFTEGRNSPKKS